MPPLKAFARPNRSTLGSVSTQQDTGSSTPRNRSSLSTNVITASSTGSPMISSSSSMRNVSSQIDHENDTPVKPRSRGLGLSSSKSIPNLHASAEPTNMEGMVTPVSRLRSRPRHSLAGTPLQSNSNLHDGFSPYYSPSTPSQLSRSTIVPFDREGSRQDAEEYIKRSAQKPPLATSLSGETGLGVDGLPEPKAGWSRGLLKFGRKDSDDPRTTKRFVRKASLWNRISSYPRQTFETLSTHLNELTIPPHLVPYLALLLHILHFLVRAPLWSLFISLLPIRRQRRYASPVVDSVFGKPETDEGLGRYDEILRAGKSTWGVLGWFGWGSKSLWGMLGTWSFFFIITALSLANAGYLFNSRRRYDMRFRSTQLNSPNAHAVPLPRAGEDDETYEGRSGWTLKKAIVLLWSYINPLTLVRVMIGSPPHLKREEEKRAQDMMQSLNVWDPPEFNMMFFIYYSPIQPILFQLIGYSYPIIALLCNISITAQTIFVVKEFERLIKDRQILQREVMREYDQVFVYKQLFKAKKDASTQTNEAEMLMM